MILEQLQIIKKFGCSKESDVTIEDIQKKEQELGVYLPIALKEFYLTFHKDDPIFSSAEYLFSLDELKVMEKSSVGRILIFEDGKRSKIVPTNTEFAFIIGDKNEDEPQLLSSLMDSDTVYYFENTQFSSWLLNQIGYQQLYASPNIIIVQEELSIPKGGELAKQKKYSVIHKYQCKTLFVLNTCNLFAMQYGNQTTYFAVPNKKLGKIDQYMKQLHIIYSWKKHDGVDMELPEGVRPPVKKRPLYFIQSAIELILEFLKLPKGGLTKDEIATTERRLGFYFPLPLREVYLQVPQKLLKCPDTLFLPKEMEWDEKRKLTFCVSEQGESEYAIEEGSPVVYIKNQSNEEWKEWSLLDCFLAHMLFWNAMHQEREHNVVLAELPECTKQMLEPEGELGRYLVSVLSDVTKGGRQQFYTTPAHDILVVRDEDDSTYLASVGREPLEWLEKESKEEFSWLSY